MQTILGASGLALILWLVVPESLIKPLSVSRELSREIFILKQQNNSAIALERATNSEIDILLQEILSIGRSAKINKVIAKADRLKQLVKKSNSDSVQAQLRNTLSLISAESSQLQLRSSIFAGLFQIIGSLLIIATAYAAIRNLRIAQKNLDVSERKLASDFIAKATDHLGDEDVIVRLGGINTLIWSAKTLPSNDELNSATSIMNTIMGFIVSRSHRRERSLLLEPISPPIDFYSAFQFLLSPSNPIQGESSSLIDLSGGNYSKLLITNLAIRHVSFKFGNMQYTRFRGSKIFGCDFDLADFSFADLSGTTISNCSFNTCDFERAEVSQACILNSRFTSTNFGGGFDLSKTSKLEKLDFSFALLRNAFLDGAVLCEVQFNGTHLNNSSFNQCRLERVSFENAILKNACLKNAVAINCEFSSTDFEEVDMMGASFAGANLKGAKNLTARQLLAATFSQDTQIDQHIMLELVQLIALRIIVARSEYLFQIYVRHGQDALLQT